MSDTPSVSEFVVRLLDLTNATLRRSVRGLTDEQLWWRPSPDTNSIAWLAWHYSRWMDGMTAKAAGDEEVWVSGGWTARFGMPAEANGLGDTPEQVGAFRPPMGLVAGYAQAAHDACVRRVQSLSAGGMACSFVHHEGSPARPVWQSLANTAMDFTQHVGQIAYVRGLLSGFGWR